MICYFDQIHPMILIGATGQKYIFRPLNPTHLPAGELSANKKKEPIKRMDHTSTIEMGKIALQPKDKTPGVAKEQETPREQEKIGIFHL